MATSGTFYVYEHWRLDRDECFYVGKGRAGRAYAMNERNRHHKAIVAKLSRIGSALEVKMVAVGLSEADAFALEVERIVFWREAGVDLTNITDGGEGVAGLKMSDAAKQKMSDKKIGVKRGPHSAEHRLKIGLALRGKKFSPEHIEKLSKARRARVTSSETKEKMSQSMTRFYRENPEACRAASAVHTGRRHSEATKKLISEKSKNKVISKEQRAKISQTLTGKKQSKETIEKRVASIAKRRLESAK